MGLVAEVKKEDIFKRETKVSNPWSDPNFNKIDDLGGEPGFKVDDIPERLGLVQQGFNPASPAYYFTDLEDAPNSYGTKLQFLQTDGEGKLSWGWPFWSKVGSTVYYKSGKVAIGHAAAQTIFHISKGEETIASRISCKISPWRQWECLDSNYGFALGIVADDKKFHFHYDTPMGTVSAHLMCLDGDNSRVGILQDSPSYPFDVGGAARLDDLYLNDTNASHVALVHWNEDEASANRTLNFTLSGGDRTFALHGNLTVEAASLINQDLTTDATAVQFASLGLGTATVPHGAVGYAKLAIDGTVVDAAGPHVQFTVSTDNYPVLQIFPWNHDNIGFMFDSYYDGAWRSSDPGSNFRIYKLGDNLRFDYDSAIAAGSEVPWHGGIVMDNSGNVSIDTGNLSIKAQKELRFYDNGNYVGFEAPALSADQIWVLPNADGPANEALGTDAGGNLIWRTHDELAGFAAGEHFTMLDEDDFASNSDTQAATQQSIKAYVDGASFQPLDAGLTSLAGLVYASDSMIKVTATDAYAIRTMAEVRTDLGLVIGTNVLAQQAIGIANDNLVEVDGSPADDEYAKWTANGLEGRSYANVLSDINGAAKGANSDITSMSGITGTIATPTNLASKTTAAWNKSIGAAGDYATWAAMVGAMPDAIAHAVTVTIKTGTTLTEVCDIKNKHGLTSAAKITIQAEKYFPTSGAIPIADSATATTLRDAALATAALGDDYFNGCWVFIIHGTGTDNGFVAITDYVDATGDVVVASWTTQPDNTSRYIIVGALIDGNSNSRNGMDIYDNTIPLYFNGIGIYETWLSMRCYRNSYLKQEYMGHYKAQYGCLLETSSQVMIDFCGIVNNNIGGSASYGGIVSLVVDYLDIRHCGISDNDDQGIIIRKSGWGYLDSNFGDGNGLWGTYAKHSGQAVIVGTECSGSSGNHSDEGTAGANADDQAAVYT